MFNLVFGPTEQKRSIAILGGVDPDRIGRFRDLWVEQPEPGLFILAIYTRTGGNNRADYGEWIDYAQSLPNFVSDRDDTFDNTYATFRFEITPETGRAYIDWLNALPEDTPTPDVDMDELFALLRTAGGEVDTDARWLAAFDALGKKEEEDAHG